MENSDVKNFKTFAGRARVRDIEQGFWIEAFDLSGAEERCMDVGHRVEVSEAGFSGRGCL